MQISVFLQCQATKSDQSLSIGGNAEVAAESESEAELVGEPASPASIHDQSDLLETTTDQDLSEDANYRAISEGSEVLWAGIIYPTTTTQLLLWMITLSPGPE